MPDPVIVPPTPTVNQGEKIVAPPPVDTSAGTEKVNEIFDKVYPMKGGAEKPPVTPPESPRVEPPKETPAPTPPEAPKPPDTQVPDRKLPSFLEEALKPDGAQAPPQAPAAAPAADEWPEELPDLKTDESKANWKKFRGEYNKLKEELKKRPVGSPQEEQVRARMEQLQTANREMQTVLSRMGIEQNVEFQNQILRPLHAAWGEAARIVQESGRDPQELAKAMSLTGKAQFEALDEIFVEMPESAKLEAHEALRAYRRFENARQNALANAPQTFEVLRKKEMERQYQVLSSQKEDMKVRFDSAFKRLRDEAGLEVLKKTSDPEAGWWNEQVDGIEKNSRDLYLENTDMDKMALACVLAPAVDAYRKLWLGEQARRVKIESQLKDRFGVEPSLSESGGASGAPLPAQKMQEDLKRPFKDVFLDEFHRQQAGRR